MNQYAIHYEKTSAIWQLSDTLLQHIPFNHPNLVFCCIGTDRSTGDALGPLVGSNLIEKSNFPYKIMGTLEMPFHALNLQDQLHSLYKLSPAPYIVAIDACLSSEENVGYIFAEDGPIYPGKAFNKKLPPVGQFSIKAVVNIGGFIENTVLQNTRLFVTHQMSHTISEAIYLAWQRSELEIKHYRHYYTDNQNSWQQVGYADFS